MSAAARENVRLVQLLLSALGVVFVATSCSSPLPRRESHTRATELDSMPLTVPAPPLADKVFYNLAPTAVSHEQIADTQLYPGQRTQPVVVRPGTEKPAVTTESPTAGAVEPSTDSMLIEELQSRWAKAWASDETALAMGSRLELARRGLALSFLRADHGSGDPAIAEAARTVCEDGTSDDARLVAAAYYAHMGKRAEAENAISGLFGESSEQSEQPESDSTEASTVPFEIGSLTFASSIEGPGKFVAIDAEELSAGKSVLVYGEFRNFKNEAERARGSGEVYRRSFSALLKLLNSSGDLVDRLDFLPESRGAQQSQSPSDVTNFWARYKIPANLEAGSYTLVVEARDVLGGGSATSEIALTLQQVKKPVQPSR